MIPASHRNRPKIRPGWVVRNGNLFTQSLADSTTPGATPSLGNDLTRANAMGAAADRMAARPPRQYDITSITGRRHADITARACHSDACDRGSSHFDSTNRPEPPVRCVTLPISGR